MKFDILTLFPEMFDSLNYSILKKAKNNNLIEINTINMRNFSKNKHGQVDDTPYGGGAGMVIKPDIVYDSYKSVNKPGSKVIYLTPQGKVLTQKKVEQLAKFEHIILISGHYEGIDQRVIDEINPEEISIGNYILTGGELPAMVLIDSVARYIPNVIKEESIKDESFSESNLLEYPQYTKPETFLNRNVPEILLSGHHKNIDDWRKKQSIINTYKKRPELLSEDLRIQAEKLMNNEKKGE